jgi:hypothetical protein
MIITVLVVYVPEQWLFDEGWYLRRLPRFRPEIVIRQPGIVIRHATADVALRFTSGRDDAHSRVTPDAWPPGQADGAPQRVSPKRPDRPIPT